MDESGIYNQIVHFFVSLAVEFCKKSTDKELPSILCVSNATRSSTVKPTGPQPSLTALMTDEKLTACIRRGLAFLKAFFKQMQTSDGGIPVSGGSIESWRVSNIEIDILSHDAKLYKCDEFEIEDVVTKLAEGTITVKTIWPTAYLAESYILGGMIDSKKVAGTGRFNCMGSWREKFEQKFERFWKFHTVGLSHLLVEYIFRITVTNFKTSLFIKIHDVGPHLEIQDLKFAADFDNVEVNISGLEVEGDENPEKLMNSAIQKDKQKFKEMLRSNTAFLSKQALVVMNLQLKQTSKKSIADTVLSWCEL